MTCVVCCYCSLSFRLKADTLSSGDGRHCSCRFWSAWVKEICARYSCNSGWCWHFLTSGEACVFWRASIDCSASAGKTHLPQALSVAGSEGAVGMGGYSERYSCPEHPGKFCFPFPCLCYSRGQWSFTEAICSITVACEWLYSTPDRNTISYHIISNHIISYLQDDSSLWTSWHFTESDLTHTVS